MCGDRLAARAETDQKREVLSLFWISPRFFNTRYRSLAMFQQHPLLPQTPPLRGALISGSNLLGKRLSLFLTVHSTSF
ncbi:hypothetical protein [Rahnella sp. PCH160]|uniref:hypothetical protein n=1 Tax=Rahnella sp. PCH160 TaxID=3447928 RepID=UPI0039FBD640